MEKPRFENIEQYSSGDLAARYRSTAGQQEQIDSAVIDPLLAQLEENGYVIVEDVLAPDYLESLRADLVPRFKFDSGRNNFEGLATQRLYAVPEKTFSCNAIVEHPLALGLLDRIFSPNYLLSQLQVINILPGEVQQPLHYDDAFYPVPRPRAALGAATIFAIDDFTSENGATLVVPKSHTWGDGISIEEAAKAQIPVVMPAGSMVFFVGTLWHAGGANRTDKSRLCVTAQYCQPWCRQQENYSLSVSRERARQCSENMQRMLGYSIHSPFMGMVDGLHPKRVLAE